MDDVHRRRAFVQCHTLLRRPPYVPELQLYLADEVTPIWEWTEEELQESGVPPPYWAFAWAGGQAVARYVLDRPEIVAGRRVLDFAGGSGLCAIAAMRAGAAEATVADIDAFAGAAVALNAAANGVAVTFVGADLLDGGAPDVDLILAGDVCYEHAMAGRVVPWLRGAAAGGIDVLLGDPGRRYLPADGLTQLAAYDVPTTPELEESDFTTARVYALSA
ncbi:MAG TPA: 50S ribosomal protein L11 methyltransferase [Mycobacteriales bacterium]|nr:50S ribosomal protein L11 methyltransferase [Mycobacteriales bacterium]